MRSFGYFNIATSCIFLSPSHVKAFIFRTTTISLSNHYAGSAFRSDIPKALFYADNKMNPDFDLSLYPRDNFNNFLTQCSIQSFLYLLREMKDVHTIRWVEKFTQPADCVPEVDYNELLQREKEAEQFKDPTGDSRLLRYHGLSALNTTIFPTWESYFKKLINAPTESHLIQSSYKYVPDYELDIEPAKLCSRMISVRQQIAEEFINDLDVISRMGSDAMETFYEKIRSDDFESEALTPQSLMFLDYEKKSPSPLRKHNFDLLKLFATQESIYRILEKDFKFSRGNSLQRDAMKNYLHDFFIERMESHFVGYQNFYRADEFLKELLLSTPKLILGTSSVVDPTGLAKLILMERERVALDWKECAKSVPDDHTNIHRMQLELKMEDENVFQ